MGGDFWRGHWHHVLGGGGLLIIGRHLLYGWLDRRRERDDKRRSDEWLDRIFRERRQTELDDIRRRRDNGRLDDWR